MKLSRIYSIAAVLLAFLMLSSAVSAQDVYVRNKPFKDAINIGGTVYVPFAELMGTFQIKWYADSNGNVFAGTDRRGGHMSSDYFEFTYNGRTVGVQGMTRGDRVWVPVKQVAEVCGYEVNENKALGTLDIMKGREINAADRKAAAEIEAEHAARERELQEKYAAMREARLAAQKEKEAKEAAAKSGTAEKTEEGAFPEGFDKTSEASKDAEANAEQPAAETAQPAAETADAGAASDEAAEAEEEKEPEHVPEAKLFAFYPRAICDDGRVNYSVTVKNTGDKDAANVRATLVISGPDGSVWDTIVKNNASVAAGASWQISDSYSTMRASNAAGGIDLTVKVTLNFDK